VRIRYLSSVLLSILLVTSLIVPLFIVALVSVPQVSGQPPGCANHVVISEVYADAIDETTPGIAEFLELYNPTSSPIVMTNWKIGDNDIAETAFSGTIPAYGFFVIAIDNYKNSSDPTEAGWPNPDVALGKTAGFFANGGDEVYIKDGAGNVVDVFGYGAAAENWEGTKFPTIAVQGQSYERKSGPVHDNARGNGYDTDNNANDFYIRGDLVTTTTEAEPQNTSSPPERPYQVYFEKECMPDLGQHCRNWCWCAAAANSIYWYSQNGYPELLDAPENPGLDNWYVENIIPEPGCPSPEGGYRRLLQEIALDCGHVYCEGILDNEYFYGLQKFINDQGAPLIVHEIVDPALSSIPPPGPNVEYRLPTLIDYQRELENCQDVLLWLNYRHTYPVYEDTDHVVTGVGFWDNSWIVVSDPWTTGAPDHNNVFENKIYDNLQVLSAPDAPLLVRYAGIDNIKVSKMVYISPAEVVENYYYEKECMPDLGQHSVNWCWAASAANSFWWYAQNGYPELIDDPAVPGLDNLYVTTIIPEPGCPSPEGGYLMLLQEIALDCGRKFCDPVSDNDLFYGLKKFIADQGAKLYVHEIITPGYPGKNPIQYPNPPYYEPGVEWREPTFKDYERELLRCQDVLLVVDWGGPLNHMVTGVAFYDNPMVPGDEWILVSDPWTTGMPDHNNVKENKRYDNCLVISTGPPFEIEIWGMRATVVKMIYVSPKDWFEKECMPDLGQHSANWCWVASAANSFWWYAQNGYPELIDNLEDPTPNDNRYITDPLIPEPGCPSGGYYVLLQEIARDCGRDYSMPVTDNELFYGLKKFIKDQGLENRLKVEEIITPGWIPPGKYPIEYPNPPENEPGIVMEAPTFDNYKEHLLQCHDVLLVVDWDCDPTNHMVTGVGFYDNENVPGDEWILVSDPWTTGAPDHNNIKENKWYDNCQVIPPESPYMLPFRITIHGAGANVVKMIYISPIVAPWTGTATFKFEYLGIGDNIYKLNLYKDNLWVNQGSKLVVKFYKYDNSTNEENNVIHENFALPWRVVPENENVYIPSQTTGVKIARFVLTDNAGNVLGSEIASFVMRKSDLFRRYSRIKVLYTGATPAERSVLFGEYSKIKIQYSIAPA